MASTIKIKRSGTSGTPAQLSSGELAYSWKSDVKKLYIGWGSETVPGIADNISAIGGEFYTNLLDVTPGTLTASKTVIVDSNSKINNWNVGNITLTGSNNTISSTNTDGNILLDPNGTGYVQIVGTNSLVIPVGTTLQRGPTTTGAIRFNTDTSQYEGYSGTNWASLGGVRSVDGLTYIVAELTPGSSDDTLYFYTATGVDTNKVAMQLDATSLELKNTTDATSTTTGSFFTAGGVGIAKKLYVGTDLNVLGNANLGDTTADSHTITGELTVSLPDDDTVALDIKQGTDSYIKVVTTNDAEQVAFGAITDVKVLSTTAATSTTTGAFTVAGGAGIAGALYVGGAITADSATFLSINNTPIGNITPSTGAFSQLDVDNIRIDGNVISSTNTNGDISITPNGSGKVTLTNPYIGSDSIQEYVEDRVAALFVAGEGIDITYNDVSGTLTVDAEIASSSNLGVATFNTASFDVSVGGDVTIKTGGVSNTQLANSSVTIGSTTVALGGTSTSIAGVTELTVDNVNINGNTITATNTDGSLTLAPNGAGTVDVSGKRITSVGTPTQATDAATKEYVDAVSEGLRIHASVDAATPNTLANITSGTVTYNNGTNGVGATLTLSVALTTLDGYTLVVGDRILVKNEATMAHNGIYVYTDSTTLTRAPDYNSNVEIAGGDFVFVVNGDLYNSTGWVQVDPVTVVGTDKIEWQQFSGAGTYLAGDGLSINGSTFSVNVPAAGAGGLEITADNVQIASTLAGNGLTYSTGVLAVGGTADRITISADAVDIASTYVGQSSITTLGTIGTGTWNATTIGTGYGGTGLTTYTTGDLLYASGTNTLAKLAAAVEGKILQIGAAGVPVWGDIDGGTY